MTKDLPIVILGDTGDIGQLLTFRLRRTREIQSVPQVGRPRSLPSNCTSTPQPIVCLHQQWWLTWEP